MINTIIETYDGSEANKRDCRFIKGNFYIKNKQCFQIDGTWYRVNSGFITFDNEKQEWVVTKNNSQLIRGIIGYDSSTNDAIIGLFSPNPYKNAQVIVPNGNSYICIDWRILPKELFIEDVYKSYFIHISLAKTIQNKPYFNYSNNGYPFSLPYCVKHYDKEMFDKFTTGASLPIDTKLRKSNISSYIGAIKDYTFGFEFETNKGKIPNYKIMESGLLPLRDGSIPGIEFATIPLRGKTGIDILENACNLLNKYTTFTQQESLHLHIGNTPSSKEFIGTFYTVCCILEKEIYSLFPMWYAKTSEFKSRGKDYNMPLKKELVGLSPVETFDNIAFYLSEGKKYQGLGANHPSDPEGQHKWQINSRYHWVNLIPLLYGNNKTIEFRVHVPTNDPIKVINWLYICSAIIKYTEKLVKHNVDLDTERSLKLSSLLDDVYEHKLATYLNWYVEARKRNRIKYDNNSDYTGFTEIDTELRGVPLYADII